MIGRQIAQYRIMSELGGGGMGTVYRAEDTRLGRDVALKVLSVGRSVSKSDTDRFLKEAQAAAALRHPNICTVYDAGEAEGVWFISMAYIPGRSLRDITSSQALPCDRALDIAIQMARALKAAHSQRIVHCDVKSANVIVDDDGVATVLDFGIAKLMGHTTQSGQSLVVGTVSYMSPEQASGGVVDHRTDIWSLGVCLYEMLAGELPFKSDHNSAIIYQIINRDPPSLGTAAIGTSSSVIRIVRRAMEKKAQDRYHSIDDMLVDLERAKAELESGAEPAEPSIAVLPFTNLSTDAEQDYFCDGMAEEVINRLVHVVGLRVVARTSSFAFRNSGLDIREIGRKLSVDNVMEGSVQKAGTRLRITAQLISVSDGFHLWSQRYDRELEDVFAIQDEIARSIVEALAVKLTDREKRVIERVPTRDIRAYDFFMHGLHLYHQMDKRGLELARNMFTSAIVRDPDYAPAYSRLADCYSMIRTFYDEDHSNVENALTASEKALELEPDLAEARASYGLAMSLNGQFAQAEAQFQHAIKLAPKLFEAYYFYARACRAQGNLEKAAEMFEKASEVWPEDYQAPILAADTYRGLDRPDDMQRAFRRGLENAERQLEHHPEESRAWYLGAHAHLELGNKEKALEWTEKAIEIGGRDPATLYNAACLFALIGEYDRCFQCFETAVENGFSNRPWLENDPDLEPIRNDSRYRDLLDKIPIRR